jgi:hypothetical protein
LLQELRRLPAWIAIEEGADALWKPALKATPEEWQANAELKMKKAEQTITQADVSTDIANYLRTYGFGSLGDAV